jgi:hypothetical protein
MGPCIVSIFQYISNKMQRYAVYLYLETALHISGSSPPIIRSAYICIYSIWYLSHRYCYLPLSWKSGIGLSVLWVAYGVTNTRCCRYRCMRSWWWVDVPPETYRPVSRFNKLCNVASCWIYIGILLGAHPILHIRRISVKAGRRDVRSGPIL